MSTLGWFRNLLGTLPPVPRNVTDTEIFKTSLYRGVRSSTILIWGGLRCPLSNLRIGMNFKCPNRGDLPDSFEALNPVKGFIGRNKCAVQHPTY